MLCLGERFGRVSEAMTEQIEHSQFAVDVLLALQQQKDEALRERDEARSVAKIIWETWLNRHGSSGWTDECKRLWPWLGGY